MYIGNDLQIANPSYKIIDDISSGFNGSTTSFALQVGGASPVPFPINTQQVMISVNGVVQEPDPGGSAGFKLLGSNIVFSSAPANGHAFFGVIYAGADYVTAGSEFPDGTVASPSFTFESDTDTGWYRIGSGSVGFTSNGVKILDFDGNGLDITGTCTATSFVGALTGNASGSAATVTGAAQSAITSLGTLTGLTVSGDVSIADKIVHTGDTNTALRFPAADTFSIETGGSERARVDSSGRLLVGATTDDGTGSLAQVAATGVTASFSARRYSNSGGPARLYLFKSRGTSINAQTIVQDGDDLGEVLFQGSDGTDAAPAALIKAQVDGTPGNDDMPGRLVFSTTADGAVSSTERLRITSKGDLNLGATGDYDDITGHGGGLLIGSGTGSDAGIMMRTGASGTSRIYFGDNSGNSNGRKDGFIVYSQTNRQLTLGSAQTTALTLDSSQNATFAGTVSDSKGNLRSIPQNTQGSTYTLVAADAGKHILASGTITVPNSVFSAGDAVTIVNNTGGDLTITKTITTMYLGTDASSANRTLATRGMATILFASGTVAYISGAGLS